VTRYLTPLLLAAWLTSPAYAGSTTATVTTGIIVQPSGTGQSIIGLTITCVRPDPDGNPAHCDIPANAALGGVDVGTSEPLLVGQPASAR
jgi:hypothetical protein